jgi:cobalt-zinc-cadmium efflux system protein
MTSKRMGAAPNQDQELLAASIDCSALLWYLEPSTQMENTVARHHDDHDDDDHDDHHDHHDHHDDHGHSHAPKDFGRAFAIGTVLNAGFVVVEGTYGILSNSMALLADAGHNLSDVFGLLMAWGAATVAKRAPTARFTYGLRSSSILAALANAILLLIAVGAIAWEAVQRFSNPETTAGYTVMVVAAIGIVINTATALMFFTGGRDDINIRAAFMHMAGDAAISLGVVLAGLAMVMTGVLWIDPVVSLLISAIIVWGTWSLLRDSVNLALHGVPSGIDVAAVRAFLAGLPGVASVHDLHIWPMSTTETALTCHLVMPAGHPGDEFLCDAAEELEHHFNIAHPTLQIEKGDAHPCALAPDHVV